MISIQETVTLVEENFDIQASRMHQNEKQYIKKIHKTKFQNEGDSIPGAFQDFQVFQSPDNHVFGRVMPAKWPKTNDILSRVIGQCGLDTRYL